MKLQVEISESAGDLLVELARLERRCLRQQAAYLLEKAIERTTSTTQKGSRRAEELAHVQK
jgi:hypothetical protein